MNNSFTWLNHFATVDKKMDDKKMGARSLARDNAGFIFLSSNVSVYLLLWAV